MPGLKEALTLSLALERGELKGKAAMAAKNLFATAEKPKSAKGGKPDAVRVPIAGMEMFGAIRAVERVLVAVKDQYEATAKHNAFEYFKKEGARIKSRPANIRGVEGKTEGSVEMRKRSSRSKLEDIEQSVLDELKIPYETVPDSYAINKKYLDNDDLMAKVNKALLGIKDIPADFWEVSVGKVIVSDDTLPAIFSSGHNVIAQAMPIASTLALKPVQPADPKSLKEAIAKVMAELEVNVANPGHAESELEKLPGFVKDPIKKKREAKKKYED